MTQFWTLRFKNSRHPGPSWIAWITPTGRLTLKYKLLIWGEHWIKVEQPTKGRDKKWENWKFTGWERLPITEKELFLMVL